MACYYIVISSAHLSNGHFRNVKGVFRGPLGKNGSRNLDYAETQKTVVKAASFYCELCDKQYHKHQQYDNHINSYDHAHRQRLKDLKQREFARNVASKSWKDERKQERALRRLHHLAEQRREIRCAPGSGPMFKSTTVAVECSFREMGYGRDTEGSRTASPLDTPALDDISSACLTTQSRQAQLSHTSRAKNQMHRKKIAFSFCIPKRAGFKLESTAAVFSENLEERPATPVCGQRLREVSATASFPRPTSPPSLLSLPSSPSPPCLPRATSPPSLIHPPRSPSPPSLPRPTIPPSLLSAISPFTFPSPPSSTGPPSLIIPPSLPKLTNPPSLPSPISPSSFPRTPSSTSPSSVLTPPSLPSPPIPTSQTSTPSSTNTTSPPSPPSFVFTEKAVNSRDNHERLSSQGQGSPESMVSSDESVVVTGLQALLVYAEDVDVPCIPESPSFPFRLESTSMVLEMGQSLKRLKGGTPDMVEQVGRTCPRTLRGNAEGNTLPADDVTDVPTGVDSAQSVGKSESAAVNVRGVFRKPSHAFCSVLSKDGSAVLQWPVEMLVYTRTQPALSFSCNPLHFDFRATHSPEVQQDPGGGVREGRLMSTQWIDEQHCEGTEPTSPEETLHFNKHKERASHSQGGGTVLTAPVWNIPGWENSQSRQDLAEQMERHDGGCTFDQNANITTCFHGVNRKRKCEDDWKESKRGVEKLGGRERRDHARHKKRMRRRRQSRNTAGRDESSAEEPEILLKQGECWEPVHLHFRSDQHTKNRTPEDQHEHSRTAIDPHESGRTAIDQHESKRTSEDPHESNRTSEDPHESNRTSEDPHESNRTSEDPHESNRTSEDPHESNRTSEDPHESNRTSEDPHESNRTPEDQHEYSRTAIDQQESNRTSEDQQESSGTPGAQPESGRVSEHQHESSRDTGSWRQEAEECSSAEAAASRKVGGCWGNLLHPSQEQPLRTGHISNDCTETRTEISCTTNTGHDRLDPPQQRSLKRRQGSWSMEEEEEHVLHQERCSNCSSVWPGKSANRRCIQGNARGCCELKSRRKRWRLGQDPQQELGPEEPSGGLWVNGGFVSSEQERDGTLDREHKNKRLKGPDSILRGDVNDGVGDGVGDTMGDGVMNSLPLLKNDKGSAELSIGLPPAGFHQKSSAGVNAVDRDIRLARLSTSGAERLSDEACCGSERLITEGQWQDSSHAGAGLEKSLRLGSQCLSSQSECQKRRSRPASSEAGDVSGCFSPTHCATGQPPSSAEKRRPLLLSQAFPRLSPSGPPPLRYPICPHTPIPPPSVRIHHRVLQPPPLLLPHGLPLTRMPLRPDMCPCPFVCPTSLHPFSVPFHPLPLPLPLPVVFPALQPVIPLQPLL